MNTDFIYVLWNERTTGIVSDGHCYEPFEKKTSITILCECMTRIICQSRKKSQNCYIILD